jgi:hypothetical protein
MNLKNYQSLTTTLKLMNEGKNPKVVDTPKAETITIPAGETDGVAADAHHKKVQKQLYRLDTSEVDAAPGDQIDEAQFILLKRGGQTKRIRNNPDEIARAKEQGWVVAGSVTTEEVEEVDEGFELQKKYTHPQSQHQSHVLFNTNDQSYKVKVKKDGAFQSDMQHTTRSKEEAHIHAKKAIKMANEEVEQVDEISREKAAAYHDKASDEVHKAVKTGEPATQKTKNRYAGVQRAISHMIKAPDVKRMAKIEHEKSTDINFINKKAGQPESVIDKVHTNAKDFAKNAMNKEKDSEEKHKAARKKMGLPEETQINELSVKTLKSYIKKAGKSEVKLVKKMDQEEDNAMSTDGQKYPEKQNRHIAKAKALHSKAVKRVDGAALAWNKTNPARGGKAKVPATEETQIDELSIDKLANYVAKTNKTSSSSDQKNANHKIGVRKAIDKISDKARRITREDLLAMNPAERQALVEDAMTKQGRPSKDEGGEHIVVGLRKAISLKGNHDVRFGNGDRHKVSPEHAANVLQKHDSMAKPSEKMAYAQKVAASHAAFQDAVKSKSVTPKPDKEEPVKPTVAKTPSPKTTVHVHLDGKK